MDAELIQRTRYVLRARFRRAQTCPAVLFPSTCTQLLAWLSGHLLLAGHLHGLRRAAGEGPKHVAKIGADIAAMTRFVSYTSGDVYQARTFEEHAGVCLAMLEVLADLPADGRKCESLIRCLAEYLAPDSALGFEEALQVLRDVALDGLFECLDETLDSRNVVLGLIGKFKQRSEWFHRESLRGMGSSGANARTGERALALHLYEYLLDQGVEFFVEPSSSSGEADVVLREPQGRYVVLDAKYIRADDAAGDIKRKLAAGFHQVARYCDDYREPFGHLIVFSETRRRLSLDLDELDGWRFLPHGGCTIYYTDIWIADAPSASKLGKAEEILVSRSDLMERPDDG